MTMMAISGMPAINASSTEAERLAALRRLELMDTPDEPEFDELVATAAAICETPVSLVTLVDENRQWFKAVYGITQRETTREVSFCHHAIQQNDVMMVEDAQLDPRFENNPEVTGGLQIRFYAGVTICEPGGHAVGTLCVLDHVARHLSSEKVDALRVLGSKANARLALREQRLTLQRALAATREANTRLMAMATTDPLTALLNRRAFLDRLMGEFAEARRFGRPLSALMLDVDNFKHWNDRYGHDVGDQILVHFAKVLKESVRITDVVARYGGEEFVVLLPDTDEEDAMVLCRRILTSIRGAVWPHGPVTASVGCASLHAGLTHGTGLVTQADEALYAAKRSGKDRAVHWSWQGPRKLELAG